MVQRPPHELDRRDPGHRCPAGWHPHGFAAPDAVRARRQFNQFRFERAAEDVWHHGLVSPEQAWDYLQAVRRSGRSGVCRMETWLEKAALRPRPAQSGLELALLSIIEQAGLPEPQRQYPLRLPWGELIHLDLAWPALKLAVEPGHSWWHGGDLRQRHDQARDRACGAMGWLVVRFDEDATPRPGGDRPRAAGHLRGPLASSSES